MSHNRQSTASVIQAVIYLFRAECCGDILSFSGLRFGLALGLLFCVLFLVVVVDIRILILSPYRMCCTVQEIYSHSWQQDQEQSFCFATLLVSQSFRVASRWDGTNQTLGRFSSSLHHLASSAFSIYTISVNLLRLRLHCTATAIN